MSGDRGILFTQERLSYVFFNEPIRLLEAIDTLFVSLHTGIAVENQTDREVSYSGYVRQSIPRNREHWIMVGNQIWNLKPVSFPSPRGYRVEITHFALGTHLSGSGHILYRGVLDKPIEARNSDGLTFYPGNLTFSEE